MRRFRLSLRVKLLLASTLLLALPYSAFRSVNEMERYLREGLDRTLVGAAQALASALHERRSLFAVSATPGADVFVHVLPAPIDLDGYTADWGPLAATRQPLGAQPGRDPGFNSGFEPSFVAGQYRGYLYLLVQVRDDTVVYGSPQQPGTGNGDHLEIMTRFQSERAKRYIIDTTSPGWILATEADPASRRPIPLRRIYPIRGEWRETAGGFIVELRLPLELLGAEIALRMVDVDAPGQRGRVLSTGTPSAPYGRLLLASTEIDALIGRLGRTPGRLIRVIDNNRHVRASGGTLGLTSRAGDSAGPWSIYRWILAAPAPAPTTGPPDPAEVRGLRGPPVDAALAGVEASHWQPRGDGFVVSAAAPVWAGDDVIGAVVVAQTTRPIQTVRRQAIAGLFGATLISAVLAATVLVALATRVAGRIQRLRDQTDRAIDRHGRVVGSIRPSSAHDEIGDLTRSFADLLERLRRYNDYLERLASRLSHELRTPIAVVRSSLENLARSDPHQQPVYTARAMQGVERLSAILSRMSEATRIEQSIEGAESERVNLAELVASAVDVYRQTWPGRSFETALAEGRADVDGVPDLLAQLLDKLVSNALDFGDAAHAVTVRVRDGGAGWRLEVENYGSHIDDEQAGRLFESMVSERPGTRDARSGDASPHLGLGLYIARVITEFHGGKISARNSGHDGEPRVTFTVELPRAS